MDQSTKYLLASMVIVLFGALLWLGAPLVPAVVGVAGAGMLIYWRSQRGRR